MSKFQDIVLLTDLDGTLLDSNEQISQENLDAIDYFIAEGGQFGICTGRNRQNACALLDNLPLNGYSIFSNGSMLYDFSVHQVLATRPIPRGAIADFLRMAIPLHPTMGVHLHTDEDSFFLSSPELTRKRTVENHQPCAFRTLDDVLDLNWIKMMFTVSPEQKDWFWEQSETLCKTLDVDMVQAAPIYTEFLPKNSNKGAMVRHLRSILPPEATIVGVGDYYNDVEFIKEVDVGIYTENAPEELKATVTQVCAHHNHHALADVIHRILGETQANT
ncbi:MAG: HAD family hydrolase [Eubacteriales bacterium]